MIDEIIEQNDNNNLSLVVREDPNQDKQTHVFILARTDMEKSHSRAIRFALKKIDIRVRAVQQSNTLYICHDTHWRREANNCFEQIRVYSLIGSVNSANDHSERVLKTMSNQVVSTLHDLFSRKAITTEQYEKMMYFNQLSTFHVNKLYFIPKIHKMEVIMQPMIQSNVHEPIKAIACFLNILLEPLYEQTTAHSTIFVTGMDAIQAFEKYAEQGHLQSTTLFATFQIHDFCTVFFHDFMLEALQNFLQIHAQNKQIQGTSITIIIQLVQLILHNQYFLYENQLYQQTAGDPLSPSLAKTLTNIYLFYWQHDLVSMLINKKELFGRCLNQAIFTWNESEDELRLLLDQMIFGHFQNHGHIRITTSISYKTHCIDVQLGHDQGILQTNVYHEPNIEPYALPYVYETTKRRDHLFLIRAALIRAVLCCSNVDEFENERFYIELSLLINDASLNLIEEIIRNFFLESNTYDVGICFTQEIYQLLRQRVQQYQQQRTKRYIRQRRRRQKRQQDELFLPKNKKTKSQ